MTMKKKINFKSKKTWKNILCIFLAVVTIIGAIFGISALFKKSEETTKKVSPSWAIGGLTETGTYLETKESIYTKDAFECYGLKISLDFDNNISYRLYFYDDNNSFIESSEKLTDAFDSSKTNMPQYTKYCRVVITPNEDSKISWYEKSGYAKQLTIKVNKDQTKSDGVNLYSSDLYVYKGQGKYSKGYIWYPTEEEGSYYYSEDIDISKYDFVNVYVPEDQNSMLINFYIEGSYTKSEISPVSSTSVGSYNVLTYDCSDFAMIRILSQTAFSTYPQIYGY